MRVGVLHLHAFLSFVYYIKNVTFNSKNVSSINFVLYSLNLRSDVRSGAAKKVQRTSLYALRYCARPIGRIVSVSEVEQAERDDYSTLLAIASRREMRH